MDYNEYKEIRKFNSQNCDKKCPDCGANLQPQYYGYSCPDCGILLNLNLDKVNFDDLF